MLDILVKKRFSIDTLPNSEHLVLKLFDTLKAEDKEEGVSNRWET